jgi:hypothetical protein|uniref:Uncharacterized protein n=1 Tax=Picea glauca TaxID=3330 RepID=A0A124GP56_PICGL|nr:hypothetical protein ABT39_MTgene748 [Picea glauca]
MKDGVRLTSIMCTYGVRIARCNGVMVSLERCTFDSLIGCAFKTGSLGVHWFIGTRNDRWTDGGIHDGRAYGIREFGWKDEVIA